jgi:hypothetical protein
MSTTPELKPQTVVSRVPEQISGELDGKVVLLSIENGEYYNMNGVASRIWALIEKPTTIAAVVDQLLEEFEVERDTCEAQVIAYLGRLSSDKLLQVRTA